MNVNIVIKKLKNVYNAKEIKFYKMIFASVKEIKY